MKPEKEFLWIVNLLNSNLHKAGGCKKDYEKKSGASENNKEFKKFYDDLLDDEILIFAENRKIIGKAVDIYTIDRRRLIRRLKGTSLYNSIKAIVVREETSLGI